MATRLIKTQGTGTSTKKFTFSTWIKKSSNTTDHDQVIYGSYNDGNNRITLYFTSNKLALYVAVSGSTIGAFTTNRLFRDTNAWYHVVLAVDTTLGTSSDRIKLYVNGTQETSFASTTYPSQDAVLPTGSSSYQHALGYYSGGGSSAFIGYLSHPAYCDGTALTPTSFGSTDSTSGIWKFKPPSGFTFGNNGFHLKFENSGNLGLDSSGEGNNFTTSTGTPIQVLDTPSNNHATIDALYKNSATYTYGNLKSSNASNKFGGVATIGVSTGKWYAEFKYGSNSNQYGAVGIYGDPEPASKANQGVGKQTNSYSYRSDAYKLIENSDSSYGSTYGNGDIVGIAVDLDNNKLYFSKNGVWQNSGVPTSGSTGTGAIPISLTSNTGFWFIAANSNSGSNTAVWEHNYGNGYFGATAITSAGSNGNGSLFEYDVPSGYYALNTKNLNSYG